MPRPNIAQFVRCCTLINRSAAQCVWSTAQIQIDQMRLTTPPYVQHGTLQCIDIALYVQFGDELQLSFLFCIKRTLHAETTITVCTTVSLKTASAASAAGVVRNCCSGSAHQHNMQLLRTFIFIKKLIIAYGAVLSTRLLCQLIEVKKLGSGYYKFDGGKQNTRSSFS